MDFEHQKDALLTMVGYLIEGVSQLQSIIRYRIVLSQLGGQRDKCYFRIIVSP